ncbi:MAG: tetratricopeptide repeat protein [Acidobacteriia bacterium]|nr:tetratricopeptide repeat protein [Terriglobia bacterium]
MILTLALLALAAAPPDGRESLVQQGFDHFYNLEYDQAIADFERAIARDPASPDFHNHLAQTLVFREMYRNGALESELVSGTNSFLRRPKLNPPPETEKRFLGEIAASMDLSEAILRKNPRDTAAMYALGIAHALRSNYYWVVKKAWHDSLKDATAARRLHNRVAELEPGNLDARLVDGLHEYILGSLPWHYRMLGFLIGLHGDKQKGIRIVEDVAKNGSLNRVDAEILLCALHRRENKTRLAIPLVADLIEKFPRNFLLRLELSQMYSMAGDKAHALEAVEQVALLKKRHAPGYQRVPWEKIWFQEGTIEFWYNDLDRALENMRKVAARSEDLDLNTGVYAWLRIGQICDLTQQRAAALEAYQKAIAFAPQAEAAQESRKYLAVPYHRL